MQLAVTFLQAGPKEHHSRLPTMSLKMQVFCISIRAVNLLILIGKSNLQRRVHYWQLAKEEYFKIE
jgi:hypothetical protein